MTIASFLKIPAVLLAAALLALAGCGGGGSGSGPQASMSGNTDGQPEEQPGDRTDGATGLMPATGLRIGEVDPNTGATALSSGLLRDNRRTRYSIMDDTHVNSFTRSERGGYSSDGFQVTYTIDGQEGRIDFGSADYGADSRAPDVYYKRTPDGDQFWLWSFPDNKSWIGDHYAQYAFYNWQPGGIRSYITNGTETAAGALPGGSATYNGEMYGELFDNTVGSIAWNRSRTRTFGYLTLTANFADGSLNGRIFNLRLNRPDDTAPDDAVYVNISNTSRLDIDNGRLNDKGQFTAELTGVDTDSTASPANTVRGFEGDMLGAFYGPDAAEVAGVLNAKRVGNGLDQEFVGRFGGDKAVGAEAIVTGVNRLVAQGRTVALGDDGMARIERTATGWTATVDGHRVEFDDSDFNAHPQLTNTYSRNTAADEGSSLWSPTRGFRGDSEFEHFDVKRWGYAKFVADADTTTIEAEDYVWGKVFYAVHGDRTPPGAMPTTGEASYDGRMFAYSWPSDDALLTGEAGWFKGDMTLSADFASGNIAGSIHALESRANSSSPYVPAAGGATFNAAITGNRLMANDLAGTGSLSGFRNGSVEGAFFGPAADEANNRLLMGFFGADKQ